MSAILICGMEMPESCGKCFVGNREICVNGCPLVHVPEHGRLIDADWFAAEMKKRQEEAGKWLREAKDRETAVRADAVLSFLCEVKLTLDAAPIIIPASGGKEDE